MSVEYALWLPILLAVGLLIVDAATALMTQATMWRIAGDTGRRVATGSLSPLAAQQALANGSGFGAEVTRSGELVTVTLSRPYTQIGSGFMLSPLGTMQVRVIQMTEPHVAAQDQGNS